MAYIITGLAAFVLFLLYDINAVLVHSRLLGFSFFAGCAILAASTAAMLSVSWQQIKTGSFTVVCAILALAFFVLLVYTLFIVLSFKETYIQGADGNRKLRVYSKGVYALCRHPGVLCFTGFYFFLSMAVPTPLMIKGSIAFCVCNILYVVFQDLWTFPRTFTDYGHYKETVPFLLPTPESIRRCTATLNPKREEHDEV